MIGASYENDLYSEIAELRAEIERLTAENDVLHKTDKWRYENVERMKAEIERLRAFAQYVADMDPDNPAPLFEKARKALEGKDG